ncbi:MAG: serine/threonine protein kinase [Bradymonadaceae bacterium]|nr:serine/threonine protein kinase [Lujinxingiaceae bacterium]
MVEVSGETRDKNELAPGFVINERYAIRGTLGHGGFGRVYLAHDNEMEREVAIKVLEVGWLASNAQPVDTMLVRFRREAMIAGKIRHHAVVEVYDVGVLKQYDDNPYMIMELLEGKDLEKLLEESGAVAAQRILPLFYDVLDGLAQVHAMGIVHKDLKPANLFLSTGANGHERLKIVDFGVARILEGATTRLTKTGQVLGTPQYMAPEYFELGDVTPAVDVYQMGLILVEMLGGKPVVSGETPRKCLLNHVQGLLTAPAGLLASPLGPVIQRALLKDPAKRYQDAAEFAAALRQVEPTQVATFMSQKRHLTLAPVHMPLTELRHVLGSGAQFTFQPEQPAAAPASTAFVVSGKPIPRILVIGALAATAAMAMLIVTVGIALLVLSSSSDSSPDQRSVRIDTIPSGAVIFNDSKRVGTAPVTIPIEDYREVRLKISARHRGYQEGVLEIRGRTGVNVEIKLVAE